MTFKTQVRAWSDYNKTFIMSISRCVPPLCLCRGICISVIHLNHVCSEWCWIMQSDFSSSFKQHCDLPHCFRLYRSHLYLCKAVCNTGLKALDDISVAHRAKGIHLRQWKMYRIKFYSYNSSSVNACWLQLSKHVDPKRKWLDIYAQLMKV